MSNPTAPPAWPSPQAEIDEGHRLGVTSAEALRIAALEPGNRELRRANAAILKSASAFFATEPEVFTTGLRVRTIAWPR